MGFESDILFSINTSDNYEEYDLDLVNSNLEDYKLGKIIDISLLKKIGTDGNSLKITNLKNNIKLSYKLDETLIGTSDRIYKMLRVHNGHVSLLDATFDSNTNELLFETDKFSTYAILYKDYKPNSNVPNPKTDDNIIFNIIIGSLSLIGLLSSVLYIKRKSIINN